MVLCCVPNCGSDSWKCDPSVTFHDFPPNPDLAAKWIKQINNALQRKPMWFPRGKPVICSKHFLQTDFKPDSDALKPCCLPTVFGFKYIGSNPDISINYKIDNSKSPLIVKVLKPEPNGCEKQNESITTNLPSQSNSVPREMPHKSSNDHRNKSSVLYNGFINKSLPSKNRDSLTDQIQQRYCEIQHKLTSNSDITPNALKVNGNSPKKIFKKNVKKKVKLEEDVIEIGPNTFLKINPDVIKVNKKQTPSGNTVLQFIMDQKLSSNPFHDVLPKVVQGAPNNVELQSDNSKNVSAFENKEHNTENSAKQPLIQHVVGHLVDTHVCKESCSTLKLINDTEMDENDIIDEEVHYPKIAFDSNTNDVQEHIQSDSCEKGLDNNSDASFIAKAPVLLTTNVPLTHCYMEKPKYLTQLKQKSRQIASLKSKIASLTKKIEELEDRCIVQERQLSYSFIKRLKTIRKNAAKNDSCATYILEQIRAYSGKSRMRWSDSTLEQCAIWCRKAPYAYEYFKKAEFFKLPCLGTVKRFMKKHPEMKFQKKFTNNEQNADEESSSDFDFDESDDLGEKESDEDVDCIAQVGEIALSGAGEATTSKASPQANDGDKCVAENELHISATECTMSNEEETSKCDNNLQTSDNKAQETAKELPVSFPITVNSSNLEVQEIILPSGEVVQCYSSNVCNGDVGGQYYIIPNVGEQNSTADHEYSVVQTESLHILQNLENSQIPMQQEQLIFITNSTEQVECSETEVVTA